MAIAALAAGLLAATARAAEDDNLLAAARRYVEQSDRYLHHTKLRRGMKGYGLTVLEGTKIARFDVEIVSVVPQWAPHQWVILAMLSGHDFKTTGVISGMSGSPIFVRDGGKDKIIGALAYAWRGQKRPLCGVQPITQMLAVEGILKALPPLKPKPKPKVPPPKKPRKKPDKKAASPSAEPAGAADAEFLKVVLDPRKRDFSQLGWPKRLLRKPAGTDGTPRLVPLTTPLMVSGLSRRTVDRLTQTLGPVGMVPVQAGTAGSVQRQAARTARLVPGASLSVALATGDADMSAVGTVTDVVGKRIIGFGHSMYAEGELAVPMGPAYVHTVVAGLLGSFKLSSGLGVAGVLDRDEQTGVSGLIGAKPDMIPMTVTVEWQGRDRRRTYRYNVARFRWMTSRLIQMLILDSAWAWREMPEHHTVRHSVEVDFEKFGRYRAGNVSTDGDAYDAASDAVRPISALRNNPYAPGPKVRRIHVRIVVEPTNRLARMVAFRLDGRTYRPGETVRGTVTLEPFRKPRTKLPVRLQLPSDLPEGTYRLTVCDDVTAVYALQREMPHRFSPRTVEQLFQSIQRTVDADASRLYLRIGLPRGGGLAVDNRELVDLPPSRAAILAEAERLKTRRFSASLVQSVATPFVIRGSGTATFQVRRRPKETLLREQTR